MHKAKNPANQILVDAITHVLLNGPTYRDVHSCYNIQHIVDRTIDGTVERDNRAYNASGQCAVKKGYCTLYPVTSMYMLANDGLYDYGMPHGYGYWDGYVGALRRQWMHEVREFVISSEEFISVV